MLTLMMKGDGPINGVTVTADSKGNVKGYVGNLMYLFLQITQENLM